MTLCGGADFEKGRAKRGKAELEARRGDAARGAAHTDGMASRVRGEAESDPPRCF